MRRWTKAAVAAFVAAGLVTAMAEVAAADPVEDFYRGKQIRAIVGLQAGSDYDLWMRVITRHWGQYIPGHPSFIVENMPGAGQIVATNYIANIADKGRHGRSARRNATCLINCCSVTRTSVSIRRSSTG